MRKRRRRTDSQSRQKYEPLIFRRYIKRKVEEIAYSVLAMSTGEVNIKEKSEQKIAHFDTDSEEIGIDNRCSACLSHKIEDFIDVPIETDKTIKGFGGARVNNIMRGTIKWEWADDSGKNHSFVIPNSYYVPSGSVRLLSPQHWAQSQIKSKGKREKDIGCNTKHNEVIMYWNNGCDKLTVPISKRNNVATFHLAAGYRKFNLFCKQAKLDYEQHMEEPMICMPADIEEQELIPEDESSGSKVSRNWPKINDNDNRFDIDVKSDPEINDKRGPLNPRSDRSIESELLDIHQRYGHISFKRRIEMSRRHHK